MWDNYHLNPQSSIWTRVWLSNYRLCTLSEFDWVIWITPKEKDVLGTNGKLIYFMFQHKRNIVNLGRWVVRGKRGIILRLSCVASEGSVRLFYIGTHSASFCWAVWDRTELDWSTLEVPANHVHTHLGGMWAIVPVNGEDVFQVGCKECTGHWEWVSLYVCVFVFACVFGDRAAQISLNGWHRYRILFPLLRSAMESRGNHMRW